MNKLLSVIVPVYNGEKYIYKLFNSMLNQSINFERMELIFINNVSTDKSLNYLTEISKNYDNVKIINLEKHYPTPGHSRNIGIQEATTEYVMFCDGDDIYNHDFCKTMYEFIFENDVDLVSSRYTVNINDKKQFLNNSFLSNYDSNIKLNSINEFPEVIQTQANLTIWNKIYKRSFLIHNNITFIENHWAEDFLFSLECFIKSKGILLLTQYSGYIYNIIENSQSHNKPSKQDFFNNGLVPLNKAEKLLLSNNMEVMPFVSEFIVSWTKLLLESDLNKDDLTEIYIGFQKWFKKYSLTNKLVNLNLTFNVLINISIKLISLNKYILFFINYLFKLF